MTKYPSILRVCTIASLLAFAAPAFATQAFTVVGAASVPMSGEGNSSSTENVDFGDVDLDGDWDAAFADGGDGGNDQNRLWINRGGLQGGVVGQYRDLTAARFPALSDDSRDIEFADIDNDGDLDIYISNTAQIAQQGNRWWINDGGLQGGSLGYYTDETGSRWIGIGGTGPDGVPNTADDLPSSIPDGLLIDDGLGNSQNTFIDWSCDCDFGDLDNDGDLDLVHSTYGGAFGGQVPTRIFLNDSDGFFEEFNPTGWTIPVQTISNGMPGLWCEGTQQSNTTNSDGTFCDIASSPLDVDIGDIDGDLDLDILHGARQELPRMFENRLEENGGSLGFRDVTGSAYPANYSTGDGHYEQEFGDMDNDGDLDIYGLNWRVQFGLTDTVMANDGSGNYPGYVELPNSGSDDNEGDFIDFDNDGLLDIFVANFSGQDRLYRNDTSVADALVFTEVTGPELPSLSFTALDADAADVDNDGDYDILIANDNGATNQLLRNITGIPDTHAPKLYRLESVAGASSSVTDEVVRVQVYDNAPYYINWYNDTRLEVTVNGIAIPDIEMMSSGGQIFRGVLPGNLVGNVSYVVRSSDQYGNTGSSAVEGYTNTGPTGTVYGNSSPGGLATPAFQVLTSPFAGKPLYLAAGTASAGTPVVMGFSLSQQIPSLDFGDGLILNLGLPLVAETIAGLTDASGYFLLALQKAPPILTGVTVYAQFRHMDGGGANTWASSAGLALNFQ